MRVNRLVLCDEDAAYAFVEAHAWPNGPVCPHCTSGRAGRLGGASTRIGTYKCYDCRQPFTVKIGTIFQSSHVPLHVWLQAIYLIAARRERLSGHGLHERLGVTVKTACHMVRLIHGRLGTPHTAHDDRSAAKTERQASRSGREAEMDPRTNTDTPRRTNRRTAAQFSRK